MTQPGIVQPQPTARRGDVTVDAFFNVAGQILQRGHLGVRFLGVVAVRVIRRQDLEILRRFVRLATVPTSALRAGCRELAGAIHAVIAAIVPVIGDRAWLDTVEDAAA